MPAKIIIDLVVAYALSTIDLITDFIPISVGMATERPSPFLREGDHE